MPVHGGQAVGVEQGDILVRARNAWTALPPGTSGQVLVTRGPGYDPEWEGASWTTGPVFTQTYATANATLGAYTPDAETVAYTGATDGEAQLADLQALRVAYENLRLFTEDLAQFVNALVDEMQVKGIVGSPGAPTGGFWGRFPWLGRLGG